ncbi:MAG: arginine--tRNA ligase [Bacteroidetes bacterium]|nr:arginine--tRNA ligase [Bacteroidota bacterium]
MGLAWADGLFHLSYGMVDLPSGKMKSREGTVVDADDLMDEVVAEARATGEQLSKLDALGTAERDALFEMIGLAALKYFLLKVDPAKRMLFDPKASIDLQGHTGPFIQYTYARIRSLLRKAEELSVDGRRLAGPQVQPATANYQLLPEEKAVLKLLHQFPAVLNESATKLEPSALANHAYEVVKAYNAFYQSVPVLKEEDPAKQAFRLRLSSTVAAATSRALWCLGIEAPERM